MAYTPNLPLTRDCAGLRARIPGWGADLDPKDRPSFPKLQDNEPPANGAHWEFPERQPSHWPRERSIEHQFLTPVLGTSCPPKGISGAVRKFAYRKYSEARAAHWLLLIAADRVDALESHLASFLTARPDNPLTETGIRSEFTHHGYSSRAATNRADLSHAWMDPIIVGAPWIIPAVVAALAGRALLRRPESDASA
ncbi:hypothetical protein BST27_26650 [Mycobacterium intermedium]|uniref:Uncharacterized protein n=1 Tax=Mycobacterium intermedium TaxID=28445 RepID=A0A1E3SJS8_MYCIE|nr:hypothetical protein [Mycobacterium intermedium]MCV6962601.1 hypothetical protein [Mycobacterium intermedium]ODR02369.1 hypothetical protein BHQ20_04580 [Mycobacterium intermedium]OPE48262.1 hypothetical protein BV508_18775 [Mycobacterium intermedium]ORA95666.1 hypothetical protein BST27_26650 [Mycobacterium intermedium]